MRKVLLITRPIAPPWDEASKNFAYYLAKNLTMFEMYILTNGFISNLPPHIHQKPIYTSNKLTYLQRVRLLKLRGLLAKNNFDILHYMLTPSKLNSFSFKTFIRNEHTKTIQTIATLREDLLKDKDFKKILFADLIITYSDYAKNKLNRLGFNNVKRVYPGIDLDMYKSAEKDPDLIRFFGLKKTDFIIQYEGEFTRLGFTDDLVKFIITYAGELRKRRIKIIFPGRIKGKEDLEKKREVKKTLESKRVLDIAVLNETDYACMGEADFMQKKYNLSDIIIFPVRNMHGKFDIPLNVVEAMACEKPVIISDLPILSELAKDDNSVIIPMGNIEALYKAILDLYENPARRKALGKNARKFVEENFDIKKIAEIYRKIYEKL